MVTIHIATISTYWPISFAWVRVSMPTRVMIKIYGREVRRDHVTSGCPMDAIILPKVCVACCAERNIKFCCNYILQLQLTSYGNFVLLFNFAFVLSSLYRNRFRIRWFLFTNGNPVRLGKNRGTPVQINPKLRIAIALILLQSVRRTAVMSQEITTLVAKW